MKFLAFDTETWLIQPGLLTPRLVCVSFSDGRLLDRTDGLRAFRREIKDRSTVLIGHNVVFDLAVLMNEDPSLTPLIFRAFDEGRISCTKVREKMIMLSRGHLDFHPTSQGLKPTKYNMADIVYRRFGMDISDSKSADAWRLRYAELDGVPIKDWPEEASKYAVEDAKLTMRMWQDQRQPDTTPVGSIADGPWRIVNEQDQVYADWALHLQTCYGMRTDPEQVVEVKANLEREVEDANVTLMAEGLVRADGSKNMKVIKALVEAAFDGSPPTTPKGAPKTDAETLHKSGHPALGVLADVAGASKLLSAFVPVLEQGTERPLNPGYDVIKETGRTSSFKPNIQQLPRKGGIRECFIPRAGYIFCDIDYDTLELRAWAQVCLDMFGYSDMSTALRGGLDPHLSFAASLTGLTYDDVKDWKSWPSGPDRERVGEFRQLAKVANFGFPGGLGSETFVTYAAGQGVVVTPERSAELKRQWNAQWSESRDYFDMVSQWVADTDSCAVRIDRTGLIRGSARYTAACNMLFQGLAAAGAKRALAAVARECYATPSSPAFGSRPVAFIHDQILSEVPEDRAAPAAERIAEVMRDAMAELIPDVPIGASPALMRRWYKGAEPVYENGILVPWEPGQ